VSAVDLPNAGETVLPTEAHHHKQLQSVAAAVLTVSDTRTANTDESGRLIRDLLEAAGHQIIARSIVKDATDQIRETLLAFRDDAGCQAVLINGGTGLAARDTTYEAVCALLDKRLDGFGELFRSLSYNEIGSAAMLSRAVAGAMNDTAVFAMPGAPAAVRLAMERLILPELGHIAHLLTRG